jgi:predicted nucleic acid-binding protein
VAAIVDTSVLYALADRAEPSHQRCVAALRSEVEAIVVPQAVLPEIAYLIASRMGSRKEAEFLRGLLSSDWRLEPMSGADLSRTAAIMDHYADANLGFVDAAVAAVAERLAVKRIYTLDRRGFGLMRPSHVEAFEVLP